MSSEEQFDGFYREILHRGKGIDNLFNSLFSFLRRNSDFFEQSEQGFVFIEKSFKAENERFLEKKRKEKERLEKLEKQKLAEKVTVEPEKSTSGVKEITKEEFEKRKREEAEALKNAQKQKESETVKEEPVSQVKKEEDEADSEEKQIKKKLTPMDETVRAELLKKTAHLDDKNGGRSRNYTWVQPQVEQFEMFIPINKDVKGSEVKIDFDSKHLKVTVRGEVLVNGDLFNAINSDSLFWEIDENKGGKYISITWDKITKMQWWDCVIKGDDILALSKVNPEPSKLSDLDPSMRPEIEKMMLENSMKMQNKPFHKDAKTNDMLQKFMKEHPEMDFSKAKIN